VVLSACRAGALGPRGLAWAFARAGARAVAAARDDVDDLAAARWSEKFYPALAHGLSFTRANREARSEARFVVLK
jgi:CHAT domain-containing protein